MESAKKRALELAEIIASTEEPSSKVLYEAREELKGHLKKLDSETQRQVMERIRGYA